MSALAVSSTYGIFISLVRRMVNCRDWMYLRAGIVLLWTRLFDVLAGY